MFECCISCLKTKDIPTIQHGKYPYIGVLPFRFPDSTFTLIFYPAENNNPSKNDEKIIREIYKYRIGDKSKNKNFRDDILDKKCDHRFILKPKELEEKLPIVIFSHGLGGNADSSSKLCAEVASLGYIVIAIEHEDGSADYALNATGEKIEYRSYPKGFVYNRENVVKARQPFLEKRKNEIKKIVEFLKSEFISEELFKINKEVEEQIFSLADISQFHIIGHSFGGSTILSLVHSNENEGEIEPIFKSAILLDAWIISVEDKVMEDGVKLPLISFLSSECHEDKDYSLTQTILKNSNTKLAGWFKNTYHSQFDGGDWYSTQYEASVIFYAALLEAIEIFLSNPDEFSKEKLKKNQILEHKLE